MVDRMTDPDLSAALERLPTATNRRSAAEVAALARRRVRRRRGLAAGIAVLAAASALLVPEAPGLRARGVGAAMPVSIEALAEGPSGLRPLRDGDLVRADERVVFRLDASGPGDLSLAEADGARIWPLDGRWTVAAGRWFLGDPPLAWAAHGRRTVVASLCDDRGDCSRATFTLTFAP